MGTFKINGNLQVTGSKSTFDAERIILQDIGSTNNHVIPLTIAGLKSFGYPVYDDPEFASGTNSVGVYNNSGGGTVTIERIDDNQGSANSSGKILKIYSSTGTTSPGRGGFYQRISSRANAVFVQIFRAKIPTGFSVVTACNSMGSSYNDTFITDTAGTGKWEWYARMTHCGADGTFSSGGHVYLSGSGEVTWYLSYCNLIDITKGNYDGLRSKYADSLSHALSWTNAVGTGLSYNGSADKSITSLFLSYNQPALRFRESSYLTAVQYMTEGSEALVFGTQQSVTSFIFKSGISLDGSSYTSTWSNIVPSMMIRGQAVYINTQLGNYVTPTYNLMVTGTAKVTSTITAGESTGATGETTRLIITPTYHSGGPWYINSYDDSSDAYIKLKYGGGELFRIKHDGTAWLYGGTTYFGGSSYYITNSGSYYNGTAAYANNSDKLDGYHYSDIISNARSGLYIGTTAVQTSSAAQAVTGITALTFNGSSSAGTNYITGAAGRIYFGGNFHIDSLGSYATYINYYTGNNVYMCSGSSQGKVGIGTTSPSTLLHVNGDSTFGSKSIYYQRGTRGAIHHEFVGNDADYGVVKIMHNSTEGSGSPGAYTASLGIFDNRSATISGSYQPTFYINRTGATRVPAIMGVDVGGYREYTLYDNGSTSVNDYRVNDNLAYSDVSPVTGIYEIKFPERGSKCTMFAVEIDVYEYTNSYAASKIIIGFYVYNSNTLHSYHTSVLGTYDKAIRIAYKGNNPVILLGNTNTSWSYPKVYLRSVKTGHSSQDAWSTGYTITSGITDESVYSNIITPTRKDVVNSVNSDNSDNSDKLDGYHWDRFTYVYNSGNYNDSSGITANDLAYQSNSSVGMIYSSTDNPTGGGAWNHIWSQAWTKNNISSWCSQIALCPGRGLGMYYRTTSGALSGKAWYKVFDTSYYTDTSLTSINTNYHCVFVTLSSNQTLGISAVPPAGWETHIIVQASGAQRTVTLPNSGNYISLSGTSFVIASGSYGEINLISNGSKVFIRAI